MKKRHKRSWRDDRWASPEILEAMDAADRAKVERKQAAKAYRQKIAQEARLMSRVNTELRIKNEILRELTQKRRDKKTLERKTDADSFYASLAWREVRYQALVLSGGRCKCCGTASKDGARLHVDHVKPRSKYPQLALDITNLQVLCEDCNLGKSNTDETDWREEYSEQSIGRTLRLVVGE